MFMRLTNRGGFANRGGAHQIQSHRVYPEKKLLESSMFKHRALLAVLLLLFLNSFLSHAQSAPPFAQTEPRKTSTPYTGDLSIFDSPGRDERLQINRVMDILDITPGKN